MNIENSRIVPDYLSRNAKLIVIPRFSALQSLKKQEGELLDRCLMRLDRGKHRMVGCIIRYWYVMYLHSSVPA